VPPLPGNELYRRGIALYDRGRFFEAHEVLEDLWRPARGEPSLFLQSLIHFAVAFHHHERGNRAGAERQLRKALKKLAGYLPAYAGLDAARIYREGQAALEQVRLGLPPVIPVLDRERAGPALS
jgi:predicted metal-dependent hydrolase